MSTLALIPAAGRGSRLGIDVPKVFAPLSEHKTIWTVLRDRLLPLCGRIHLVLSPDGLEYAGATLGFEPGITLGVQAVPLGMGDAIMGSAPFWGNASQLLIVWGDQVHVSARTLERTLAEHKGGLTFPVVRQADPYVQYLFQDSKLTRVLQTREGDRTQPGGLSDVGTFLLSTDGLLEAWQTYLEASIPGAATAEINFLPFLPFLSARGWNVTTVEIADADEARGVNTPEDLAFWQARQGGAHPGA